MGFSIFNKSTKLNIELNKKSFNLLKFRTLFVLSPLKVSEASHFKHDKNNTKGVKKLMKIEH